MASATAPEGVAKHGGSRPVLCWQDKLALCDKNVILKFISTAECQNKCKCFDKLRALDQDVALQVVCGIREGRVAGMSILFHKVVATPTTAWRHE